jgi:hypothetical protein
MLGSRNGQIVPRLYQTPPSPVKAHPPVVPPILRRGAALAAATNSILLLIAALGGEWVVHQLQYLLMYGNQFGWVMGSTVHRYYMEQTGLGLAAAAAVLVGAVTTLLAIYGLRRAGLLALVPQHARSVMASPWQRPRWSALFPTALAVAWIQIAVYVVQENIESYAQGLSWPGLGVLFPAHYPTVLPLHLLVALCVSFVLWSLSLLLRRSWERVRAALRLAALHSPPSAVARRLTATHAYVPSRRPLTGTLGLRAPPVAA